MKVLFISHDASRSGAPIYLYRLINWLVENHSINASILFIEGGEMQNDFSFCDNRWVWNSFQHDKCIYRKIIGKMSLKWKKKLYQHDLIFKIKKTNPQLIVANTLISLPLANLIEQEFNIPIIAIIHEMKFSAQKYYSEFLKSKYLSKVHHFIAVCNDIKIFLQHDLNIDSNKVTFIHPFIPNNNNLDKYANKSEFVVGFSGYGNWRKGIYLLPILISLLVKYETNFKFLWLGHIPQEEKVQLDYILTQLDLDQYFYSTGYVTDTYSSYSVMDVFVLLSIEDPYPLACIEACSLSIPIVCFEKSGGACDLALNGAGFVVPFLDINIMKETILMLKNDVALRISTGKSAREQSGHYDIDIVAPKIWDLFKKYTTN